MEDVIRALLAGASDQKILEMLDRLEGESGATQAASAVVSTVQCGPTQVRILGPAGARTPSPTSSHQVKSMKDFMMYRVLVKSEQ